MRLVKVEAPAGRAKDIIETAFSVGIESVSTTQVQVHSASGGVEPKDVVNVETSTDKANRYIDRLLGSEFFDLETFSFNVREPRALGSSTDVRDLTVPLEVPPVDVFEELWQFNRITYGLIGRLFIASCLLAYGIIHQQTLLMMSGILFLPMLPMVLAMGFGGITGNFRLAFQGLAALGVGLILLVLGGALMALVSSPPLKYDEFNSLPVSLIISVGVGIAAGLGSIDDSGKRELIGLAAAAQIGIIPVWLGVCIVFGLPSTTTEHELYLRILTFLLNVVTLIVGSTTVFWLTGVARSSLTKLNHGRT